MVLDIKDLDYKTVNRIIRQSERECVLVGCVGQRHIATGMADREITIEGVPGNALGAYLNGARVIVNGNAQDQVGDTMNDGEIIIHGSIGDAAGYAMRGGRMFIKGNAGYRAGIHMKAYKEKIPVMVIGGAAGSFLGEYQAGGLIIVLGLNRGERRIVYNFPCTGMHGGRMFLRGRCREIIFPDQVTAKEASAADIESVRPHILRYCELFGCDPDMVLDSPFTVVTPDSRNPYRQMYVAN